MHSWGDKDVDWEGINAAAAFIGRGLLFWRVPVRQWKEKFGTVRVYCSFGFTNLNSFTHPGYAYNQYPHCLDWVNYPGRYSPIRLLFWTLNLMIVPFHKWLYQWYYARACRRWPHLKKEIIYGADYHELLGGKVKFNQIYFPELGDTEPVDWRKE